jgi:hypothetical protein
MLMPRYLQARASSVVMSTISRSLMSGDLVTMPAVADAVPVAMANPTFCHINIVCIYLWVTSSYREIGCVV